MSYQVYVSHDPTQRRVADAICAELRDSGISCYADWYASQSGDVIEVIRQCRVVVFIFSSAVFSTPYVGERVSMAIDLGKPLIFVYGEGSQPATPAPEATLAKASFVVPDSVYDLVRSLLVLRYVRELIGITPDDAADRGDSRVRDFVPLSDLPSQGRSSASRGGPRTEGLERRPPPPASGDQRYAASSEEARGVSDSSGSTQPPAPRWRMSDEWRELPTYASGSAERGAHERPDDEPRVGGADVGGARIGGVDFGGVSVGGVSRPQKNLPARGIMAGSPPPPPRIVGQRREMGRGNSPVSAQVDRPAGFFARLFSRQARRPIDRVDCSVFAPPKVAPAESFLVQVFTHRPEQSEEAARLAVEFDPDAGRRGKKTLEVEIRRGTKLKFHLVIPDFAVREPLQEMTWLGNPHSVQFEVSAPRDFKEKSVIATIMISAENGPVGHIKFKLAVGSTAGRRADTATHAGDSARAYRKAFISYASQDRKEVLKRVQMLSRLHVQFFQDVLSLEPGARWEKELYRHIDESDLFLLFWSSAARQSKWVLEEVRYAISRKGGDDLSPPEILPVILEGPPPVEPPQELAHLHFDDYFVYLLKE
ncbi:MAG: toll/interleukin-1 receptor domain-containing protein [Acidobacteriota bacterium]|nr:toll/interleukin-1 receptor domain-containing protein [Acidobacteriota bacterium]